MGTVWIAHHQRLGVEVVVKFLSEQLAANAEACERFSREARATLRVRSPHVVQMLDHGFTDRGIPFIVMELLEGNDLARTLRDQGSLRPDEVQHVVDGLAAALSKAHERRIVHRDIKPANVFMCAASPRPFIKLVDFGISKRLEDDSMTANHAVLGTPAYMSPEQVLADGDIDHRADLWSLGVITYHMLAGEPPFRGGHVANIAQAILKGPRPKITPFRSDLPAAMDAWMERALAVDPDHRFQSAQEMAEALAVAFGDLAYAGTRSSSSGRNRSSASPSGEAPAAGRNVLGPATEPLLRVAPDISRPPPMTIQTPGNGLAPSGFVTPPPMPPPYAPSIDSLGHSYGPAVLSYPPHEPASRLKWWVMGTTAVFVVLIGVAFRVGYGLRQTVPPAAAAVSTEMPSPVALSIAVPPSVPPTSAESIVGSVSATVTATVAPPTSGLAKPAASSKKPRPGR